jgi:hypothetical protein
MGFQSPRPRSSELVPCAEPEYTRRCGPIPVTGVTRATGVTKGNGGFAQRRDGVVALDAHFPGDGTSHRGDSLAVVQAGHVWLRPVHLS